MANDEETISRLGPVFLDSYFVIDHERRIKSFNDGFVQLSGVRRAQRKDLTGSPCFERLRLEICETRCIAAECLKQGAPVRMEEVKGTASDGRELVLELSAIPLKNDQGEVTGVFVTHRDVTDERRLKSRYEELEETRVRERDALVDVIKDREAQLEKLRKSK